MKVTDRVSVVLADNPGLMTLTGTNTWVLREPGAERSVVIDPGPDQESHLKAVAELAGEVALVLVTHRHGDHTDGVPRFGELTGAPTRGFDPAHTHGAEPLTDGERIEVDGLRLQIVATPGHTTDSMCVLLPEERAIATGDTVLGQGTTVIAHPDGALGPYLDSLDRLRRLVDEHAVARLLPGHGPVIDDPAGVLDHYIAHRSERLDQVRQAVERGASTPRQVVELVYADVDPALWPAAESSVAAQLDYLAAAR